MECTVYDRLSDKSKETGTRKNPASEEKSDQENGSGRTDIVIKDRRNRRTIIIEAKKADTETAMELECLHAKQQITEKQYARGLSGYTKIICYGISFYQKTAMARLLE